MKHSKFWNLSQAAAWVVYRSSELAEDHAQTSHNKWIALNWYPTKHKNKQAGCISELSKKLQEGVLTAYGRRSPNGISKEPIPDMDWQNLILSPPTAYLRDPIKGKIEPWLDITFKSGNVIKLWQSTSTKEQKRKFDKKILKELWEKNHTQNQNFAANELIEDIQLEYSLNTGKKEPSRTTLQNYIRHWVAEAASQKKSL